MPKMKRMKTGMAVVALAATAVLTGCAGGEEQPGAQEEQQEQAATEPAIQMVEGERSEVSYPDAELDVTVEQSGEGGWVARLAVRGFELGAPTEGAADRGLAISDQGQHVHLIVDNEPYLAIYDASEPVSLGELDPGSHAVRAFPSRQWHESVKEPGAFASQEFAVGGVGGPSVMPPDEPLLTYSRPKGSYEGAGADSIMVDFYLTNVELEPGGHRVRLTVNDAVEYEITEWKPHFLVGVPPGEHTVTLELLDPAGRPVAGALNRTSRTITVAR